RQAALPQGAGHLEHRDDHRDGGEPGEGLRHHEQRHEQQGGQPGTDPDRGREVPAGTAPLGVLGLVAGRVDDRLERARGGRGGGHRVVGHAERLPCRGLRCRVLRSCAEAQTVSSSVSLRPRASSISSMYFLVSASSSFSARVPSSSPISLSLTSFSIAFFALPREPRTDTRPSSALVRASLTYSLRRSSVSAGSTTRRVSPLFVGFTPRSESRSAVSTPDIADLSYGVTMTVRASGNCREASWLSGVGVP